MRANPFAASMLIILSAVAFIVFFALPAFFTDLEKLILIAVAFVLLFAGMGLMLE